uniref:PPM-type phosphatase domain-containing protein n=1 Tax=Amphimedon queenslandica TaxID=400682 RepID=A0A1X7UBT7_AMPQE
MAASDIRETISPEQKGIFDFLVSVCANQGDREAMEDDLAVKKCEGGRSFMAAVFDGHGGRDAAQMENEEDTDEDNDEVNVIDRAREVLGIPSIKGIERSEMKKFEGTRK